MKCFYHVDMDGKCAGAIVYKYFEKSHIGQKCELIPINYKDDFPFNSINQNELVVIVDFSLQKEGDFEKLLSITENVIWIDHHKTAIEKHKGIKVAGIQQDGIAGCELTWKYFYPTKPVPYVVKLLADYDIWAFKYGNTTNYLQAGIRLHNTEPDSPEWEEWLDYNYIPTKEIEEGKIAIKYRDNYYADLIKRWSFWTEFEGYKTIACNAGSVSSQLFDSVEGYDIMCPFVFDGKQWTVSIYTKRDDIDVSKIAQKYGGGGHKKAAGFQCKKLPFKLKDCKDLYI